MRVQSERACLRLLAGLPPYFRIEFNVPLNQPRL